MRGRRPDPPPPTNTRPIAAFGDARRAIPGYAVGADGTVWGLHRLERRWKPLRPKTGPGGFRKVRLVIDRKEREIGIAQLVLRAFEGPRPIHHEPLHFPDPDPGNNRADNLRWAPVGASKAGRQLGPTLPVPIRGETHFHAVLTEPDVPEIRRLYRAGVGYEEIAERFGCAAETIRHVLIGRSWKHVPDPLGPITMRAGPAPEDAALAKLDFDRAEEIRRLHAAGQSYRQLAPQFGVSWITIRDVVKRRTWIRPPR